MSTVANSFDQAQLMVTLEEMDAIHLANLRYWNLRQHSHEEDMEHERRKERLEQIRKQCGWTDPAVGVAWLRRPSPTFSNRAWLIPDRSK